MWTMLYMIKYPETQDRMYKEISAITGGNNRKVLLEDQNKTHFLNSFVTEVVRHSPSRVLFPNHEISEDVVFEGKFFPKGTQVIS